MPPHVLTLENNIRSMRILYVILLLAMMMQVLVAERFSHQEPHDIHVIWLALLMIGLVIVGIAVSLRVKMLQPAAETLQQNPDDQSALARWRVGNILSFVLMDSVVLYGVALRFTGSTTWQSLPFYVVGMALMLVWWPRRP
jgi:hypothetical protein